MSLWFDSRYFMALVQEMALKIDQGFLAAVLAVVTPSTESRATSGKVTPWLQLLFSEPRNKGQVKLHDPSWQTSVVFKNTTLN